jgi:hypothetical protein
MRRTTDPEDLAIAIANDPEYFKDVSITKWLTDPDNICIIEGEDVSLFDYKTEGVYWGHYFFTSRGKEASDLAKAVLEHVFNEYPVVLIVGLTPIANRKARWMARHIGMTSMGFSETVDGLCELFMKTGPSASEKDQ